MAAPGRFASSSDDEIAKILAEKDSVNTKCCTKAAVKCFLQYLTESNVDSVNFDDYKPEELAVWLTKFYVDARKKNGEKYKLTALKSIRFGLARYFNSEHELDIVKDSRFKKANDVFMAMSVNLKREGLAHVDHTVPLEEDELESDIVDELEGEQSCNPFTELLILQHHTDIVRHLFILDDRRCASAGDDSVAVIWDYQLCLKLVVLVGHTRPVTCMLLFASKNNRSDLLLTGSSDKHIRVWDTEQGKCLQDITEHDTSVKCLLPFGDNMFLSAGQTINLWSDSGGLLSQHNRKEEDSSISYIILTRNHRVVAASSKQLAVYQVKEIQKEESPSWEITHLKSLPPHREAIRSLVNVSGKLFASGSLDGTILLWSSETFLPILTLNTVSEYKGINKMYPYSVQHIVCENERFLVTAIGSGFAVFDISTKRLLCKKLHAHHFKVIHLTFVCDGRFLATCSEDGSIRLWGPKSFVTNSLLSEKADMGLSTIERFLGLSSEQILQHSSTQTLPEPVLLGECLGHSGAVEMIVDCGMEGLLSCGADGLVMSWKNAEIQKLRRNRIIQEQVLAPRGIV